MKFILLEGYNIRIYKKSSDEQVTEDKSISSDEQKPSSKYEPSFDRSKEKISDRII